MRLQRTNNSFHWADYVILALSLLMSCSVGIYFALSGGKQKTTAEFLMGDRSMKLIPVSISLAASFLSAILILGHPAEIYLNGIGFHFHLIGASLAYLLAAVLFVSLFYPLRLTSVFEYLERRFKSKLVRGIGTSINLVVMIMYAGSAIFAPCTATERVTNNAVRREYVIAACGLIGTFYTLLGGMKAVVFVDAIQAGIMLAGTVGVAVKAVIDSGGWNKMWQLNSDHGRLQTPSLSPDPRERHSLWGMIFGLGIYWLGQAGVSQMSVQRFSSLPSIRSAKLSMAFGLVGHWTMISVCTLAGMAIFARYASVACDIHEAGWAGTNEIVTYYVMERINVPGFPGLFTAALLAAALSSVSSALSSVSTIAWTDLLRPYVCKKVSEDKATIIAKALVALAGILSTLIAYLVAQLGGTIIQAVSTFIGAVMGPSLGLFLLGSLFPNANWFGATVGPLAGLLCALWVGIGTYSISRENVKLPANVTGCDFEELGTTTTTSGATSLSSIAGSSWGSSVTGGNFGSTTTGGAAATQGFLAEYIYSISYVWTPVIGLIVTLLFGLLCSCLSQRRRYLGFVEPIKVQQRYLMPGVRRLYDACGCGGGIVDDEEDDNPADEAVDGAGKSSPDDDAQQPIALDTRVHPENVDHHPSTSSIKGGDDIQLQAMA